MENGATTIIYEIGQLLEMRADLAFSSSSLLQAFDFLDEDISSLMKQLECVSVHRDRQFLTDGQYNCS